MKSGEAEDMKQLEEQAKLAADALFRRKKELQRLATDFEEDDRRLRQVEGQCTRLEERNGHLAEAKQQMEVELAAQDEALEKHDERLSRLSALHRGDGEEETVQEKHFRAGGLRDATPAPSPPPYRRDAAPRAAPAVRRASVGPRPAPRARPPSAASPRRGGRSVLRASCTGPRPALTSYHLPRSR